MLQVKSILFNSHKYIVYRVDTRLKYTETEPEAFAAKLTVSVSPHVQSGFSEENSESRNECLNEGFVFVKTYTSYQ